MKGPAVLGADSRVEDAIDALIGPDTRRSLVYCGAVLREAADGGVVVLACAAPGDVGADVDLVGEWVSFVFLDCSLRQPR